MDVPHHGAAQIDGGCHVVQGVLHQHHIGGLNGDVCARPNGDAYVSPGQGGGVVDAIPHHGHLVPLLLKGADVGFFLGGQHVGDGLLDAQLLADGLGGDFVVAGEHHHMEAHLVKPLDSRTAGLPDGVRHSDDAQQLPIPEEQQGRFPLLGQLVDHRFRSAALFQCGGLVVLLQESQVPRQVFPAVYLGPDAAARHRLKSFRFWKRQPQLLGALHHSLGQGMLAAKFSGGSLGQELLLCQRAVQGEDICHGGVARGDGAGLIQNDGVHVVEVLQALGGLNQNAHLRGLACAHHDGHRGGKAQGAGAGDNQHGNGVGQGELKAHAGNEPHNGRHNSYGDDHRHKHAADLVRQPGDGRLGVAGLVHQADDLGKGGVLPHLGGLELKGAVFVDGGGDDLVARVLLHGDALARDGGLVHIAVALCDDAVYWNALAGTDDHNIPGHHLLRGDGLLHPAPEHHGGFGGQIHQLAQGVAGFGLGAGL